MTEEELNNLSDEELEQEVNNLHTEEEATEEEDFSEDTSQEEESEEVEETPEDTEEELDENSEEEDTPSSTYKIKANGINYEFTLEELQTLAPKAMDYTKKMQTIAPYRKMISALEDNGLTQEDINTLIDIKKGNKDALTSFLKGTGVDPYELDTEEEVSYTPTEYGRDEDYLALEETIKDLSTDTDNYPKTQKILTSVLDEQSKEVMLKEPSLIRALHIDVSDGTYDKVMPQAQKLAVLDGFKQPILQYYIKAGETYHANKDAKTKELKKTKKSASLPQQKNRGGKVVDYLTEEEEDKKYQEWYNSLQQ